MDIVIIGSGNVAAVLGRQFVKAGHKVLQVVSRNATAASELAYEWDTESANYISLLNRNADIYIISVADEAIGQIADEIKLPGKVVVHTAASVPAEALKGVTEHYGVLYPLQSLRKEMEKLPEIPLYINGSSELAVSKLRALAGSISALPVQECSDTQRLKLHVAAVIVSNFVNHLYTVAEDFCKKEGIDFEQLKPLIKETAERLRGNSPKAVQTGPAKRNDQETINKHLEILAAHPSLKELYINLSERISTFR